MRRGFGWQCRSDADKGEEEKKEDLIGRGLDYSAILGFQLG